MADLKVLIDNFREAPRRNAFVPVAIYNRYTSIFHEQVRATETED